MGNRILAALALGASISAAAGCELATKVDRSKIPGGGGSSPTTSSSGGGSGHGGAGGMNAGGGGANQGGGGASQGGGGAGQGGGSAAECTDRKKDGKETDVDCGGGACPPCATGLACTAGTDCVTGKCVGGACVDVLLISEVRSRGLNGQNDEFLELYNPTSQSVTATASWRLEVRSAVGACTASQYAQVWAGAGQVIPPHHHLLIVNKGTGGYSEQPNPDVGYLPTTVEVPDAAGVRLMHGSDVADALCFYYDDATRTSLTTCTTSYSCEGTPVQNPHNGTAATDNNTSLERKPGAAQGNTTDTDNNSADFATRTPARPEALASTAVP